MTRRTTHKYGAIRCERDGIKFPSKLEASYFDQLQARKRTGEVLFFLRQIPFDLPGKIKYFCDFMVFLADGNVEFVEVKGRDTPIGVMKMKQVMDLYPITIKVVYKV